MSIDRAQKLVGITLGERYRITGILAEGAHGSLLSAAHTTMGHRVAVKVLYPEAAQNQPVLAAFEREALAGGHIQHENVASATDYGAQPDGLRFLVLEFLEGTSLRFLLSEGPLSVGRALRIGEQVARALGAMHDTGIVHRGVTPDTVAILSRDGEPDVVKVTDLGSAFIPTALVEGEADQRRQARLATPFRPNVAASVYCAPELLASQGVDGRTDLYALGALLFEMLIGAPPPAAPAPIPPITTVRADAGEELAALVTSLLGRDAAARPASADEVASTLASLRAARVDSDRPRLSTDVGSYGAMSSAHTQVATSGMMGAEPTSLALSPAANAATAAGAGWTASQLAPATPPAPWSIRLAGAGAALILLTVAGLVGVRDKPYADLERTSQRSADDDDDGDDDKGGSLVSVGSAAASGVPSLELPGLSESRPLATVEARNAFETFRQDVQLRKLKPSLASLDALLKIDEHAAEDSEVQGAVIDLTMYVMNMQGNEPNELFTWITRRMGSGGPDILFKLMTTRGGSKAAQRATRELQDPDVLKRGTEQLQLAYKFRVSKNCKEKKTIAKRMLDVGDRRSHTELRREQQYCERRSPSCCFQSEELKELIKTLEVRLGLR